jgi:hypothetical protein
MLIKVKIITLFIFLQSFAIKAQENFYNFIKPGDFQVGFVDTTIFDLKYQYETYDYKGMKPYFLQIWHPVPENSNSQHFLYFRDFFENRKNEKLRTIQKQLENYQKEIIISDCIAENLETGEAGNYGDYSYEDIFNLIGKIETRSIMRPIDSISSYPIIIYHHGSQSNSFENFAMAEYFASRGYIFVAANFHLPYENTVFGLKPFEKLIKDEDEESLRTVLKFAQSLSNSSSVFFIGHSWGAQMGFRTFDGDSTINGLISLETTIEFKSDYGKIEEMWPEVYQKVVVNKSYYPFPILLCAATGQAEPFDFFKNLNAPQITFAPTTEQFEHNAYTSIFYLRYFLDKNIPQSDKLVLKDRLTLYARHLEFIGNFMNGIINNEKRSERETVFINFE